MLLEKCKKKNYFKTKNNYALDVIITFHTDGTYITQPANNKYGAAHGEYKLTSENKYILKDITYIFDESGKATEVNIAKGDFEYNQDNQELYFTGVVQKYSPDNNILDKYHFKSIAERIRY